MLLAEVDKEVGTVKIYSTWTLNWYLLSRYSGKEEDFTDDILFEVSSNQDSKLEIKNLKEGKIPVGHPILDIPINEIGNKEKREQYHLILRRHLEMDNWNYIFRRAGIPRAFGLTSWRTNEIPITQSSIWWDKRYFYSEAHANKIKSYLGVALPSLAVFLKAAYRGTGKLELKNEYEILKQYAESFLQLGKEEQDIFNDNL